MYKHYSREGAASLWHAQGAKEGPFSVADGHLDFMESRGNDISGRIVGCPGPGRLVVQAGHLAVLVENHSEIEEGFFELAGEQSHS